MLGRKRGPEPAPVAVPQPELMIPVRVPPEVEKLGPEAVKAYQEAEGTELTIAQWVERVEGWIFQAMEQFKLIQKTQLNHKEGLEALDVRLKLLEDAFKSAEDVVRQKGTPRYLQ